MNYIGELNGLQYKQGLHGFAYYMLAGEWMKSDKKALEIHEEIESTSRVGANQIKNKRKKDNDRNARKRLQ